MDLHLSDTVQYSHSSHAPVISCSQSALSWCHFLRL